MNTFSERLLYFIKQENSNVSTFEKNVGLSNGYVKKLKSIPSEEKLSNILDYYPKLNRVWLLTGEGEMLNKSNNKSNIIGKVGDNSEVFNGVNGNITITKADLRLIEKEKELQEKEIALLKKEIELLKQAKK